jgi:hypothetical protein
MLGYYKSGTEKNKEIMNSRFEYIKDHPPFGALRQIPEQMDIRNVGAKFDGNRSVTITADDRTDYSKLPLYPLSTQPSNEWMQRKEHEEGVDFELQDQWLPFGVYPNGREEWMPILEDDTKEHHRGYRTRTVAIPIEKKDDLVASEFPYCDDAGPFKLVTVRKNHWKKVRPEDLLASQNHPQPSSSLATLACTEGNSIEHEGGYYYDLFKFFSEQHGLTLVDTEIQDIIRAVETFNNHPIRKIINEK